MTSTAPPAASTAAASSTPTVRQALRRGTFWIVAAFVAVAVAVAGILINGATGVTRGALEADNPAPRGSMAIAEVLRQRGVDVRVVDTLEEARASVVDPENTTVLFSDRDLLLTDEQRSGVGELGADLVLVSPDFETLAELAPGVALAGAAAADEGSLEAGCSGDAAPNAATIAAEGTDTFRIDESALPEGVGAVTCFPGGDESYALIRLRGEDGSITVLDGEPLLTNDGVIRYDNAALALTVLGANETLVWYIPTPRDVEVTGPPSLARLTPGWVTPGIVLLTLVTLAAAVWRGRRFGPLVVENLPVTVRASETVEGRARLYERASARGRALDALRVGAVARIASALRLARTASVNEVVGSAAAATGQDPAAVHATLVGELPKTDRELLSLSDRLSTLEASVRSAVDPTGRRNP